MTAAAWTATPSPTLTPTSTPTPTPIPYGISLHVTDSEGNSIEGATVRFVEVDQTLNTDTDGLIEFQDYSSDTMEFSVDAQGYLSGSQSAALERGSNLVSIELERDPYGLLPSQGCNPDETVFAIYDFENGSDVGWSDITEDAQGYSIVTDPNAEENMVLQMQGSVGGPNPMAARFDFPEYFAWRFWVQPVTTGALTVFLSGTFEEETESFYQVVISTGGPNSPELRRIMEPGSNTMLSPLARLRTGEWSQVELSRFEDTIEIWQDNQLVATYQDSQPLEATSNVMFGLYPYGEDSTLLIDNMSICDLSAPFTPLPTPESSE